MKVRLIVLTPAHFLVLTSASEIRAFICVFLRVLLCLVHALTSLSYMLTLPVDRASRLFASSASPILSWGFKDGGGLGMRVDLAAEAIASLMSAHELLLCRVRFVKCLLKAVTWGGGRGEESGGLVVGSVCLGELGGDCGR